MDNITNTCQDTKAESLFLVFQCNSKSVFVECVVHVTRCLSSGNFFKMNLHFVTLSGHPAGCASASFHIIGKYCHCSVIPNQIGHTLTVCLLWLHS